MGKVGYEQKEGEGRMVEGNIKERGKRIILDKIIYIYISAFRARSPESVFPHTLYRTLHVLHARPFVDTSSSIHFKLGNVLVHTSHMILHPKTKLIAKLFILGPEGVRNI